MYGTPISRLVLLKVHRATGTYDEVNTPTWQGIGRLYLMLNTVLGRPMPKELELVGGPSVLNAFGNTFEP